MSDLAKHRDEIIPYRMQAVDTLNVALTYDRLLGGPKPMQVYFDGRLVIEGLSTAFTNPSIEAGVVHGRALLDFVGLKLDPRNPEKLAQRSGPKRPDDVVIEDFCAEGQPLPLVSVQEAVSLCVDAPDRAERALACLIATANKGIAHSTLSVATNPDDAALIEVASRLVPELLVRYFYRRLDLPPPSYLLSSRKRAGAHPQTVGRRHTMRARIAIAAGLVALALIVQAIWYRGMSRRVVAQAEVLRQHFGREVSRDDSRSRQAARLHHRALAITKIVCNGWGPLFFIPCLLCVGAVGVLLFRPRKELRAHGGPVEDAQPTDGSATATPSEGEGRETE